MQWSVADRIAHVDRARSSASIGCTDLLRAPRVSLDFFTVPTVTGRVLFVLVLLSHHRRRIVHLRITEHPTAAWTAQQLIEAFPEESGSALAATGSGRHLWGHLSTSSQRYGYP